MSDRLAGTITALKSTFGFILDDEDHSRFFAARELKDTKFHDLREGDRVTFEAFTGPRGHRAEVVRRAAQTDVLSK